MVIAFSVAWAGPPTMPELKTLRASWALDSYEICYPSGMLVHLVRRPGVGVVSLAMVVGGGESAETDDTRGAAHLVEHLWFGSHPGGGPSPWDLEPGLALGGSATVDATLFTTVGAAADIGPLLSLEVERVRDPLQGVDAAAVEREKRVVRSELAGDHADLAALRLLDVQLWPEGHPYARTMATIGEVDRLTLADLQRYAGAHYQPRNVVLRIEGDLDPRAVEAELTARIPPAWLDGEPDGCRHEVEAGSPPPPRSTDLVRVPAVVHDPRLYVAWSLPAYGPDAPAAELVAGRLPALLAFDRPARIDLHWQFNLGCWYVPGRVASRVVCALDLPTAEDGEDVWRSLQRYMDLNEAEILSKFTIRSFGDDLSRAYLSALTLLDTYDRDTLGQRAMSSWFGRVDPAEDMIRAVESLDQNDFASLARQWLAGRRATAVMLVPGLREPWPAAAPGPVPPVVVPDWHPKAGALAVKAGRLENGLETWVVRRPDAPYVARTGLVSRGGWATTPYPGAAEVVDVLERSRLPVEWSRLHQVAVLTSGITGPSAQATQVRGPDANLGLLLWVQRIFSSSVLDFTVRQVELDEVVENGFYRMRTNPGPTAWSARSTWLFGDHPIGDPWWERYRAARTVAEKKVVAWQRAIQRPEASVLVVASGIDATVVGGQADKMLGDWKGHGKPRAAATAPPLPPPPTRRTFVLPAASDLTEVTVSCRVPGRTDATAAGLDVLTEVLASGGRRVLRVGLGLDSVEVAVSPLSPDVAVLTVAAMTWPESAGAVRDGVFGLLDRVAAGIGADELAAGRVAATGALARQVASSHGTFWLLMESAEEGRSLAGVTGLGDGIARVDAPALAALVRDCAGHEAVTVAGPDAGVDGERLDWEVLGASLADSLR